MDFSTIIQTPAIRAIVQENALERAFHDGLFPRLLYRGEASPVKWPDHVGDTMAFTGVGLIRPKMRALAPNTDPTPSTFTYEQWTATLQQYGDSIDTHMPTSITAIADLFLRNAAQLGLSGGQALNGLVRDRMFNAALSGWTVADGAQVGVSTLRVKRLNGFTRARRPDLAAGSAVQFAPVSANNPLVIQIFDSAGPAYVTRNVTAFSPDTIGDETGPGTITFTGGVVTVADRAPVIAGDRTNMLRVGGGDSVDSIGSGDILKLSDIRVAVARFRTQNVPEQADNYFHAHIDPTGEAEVFSDTEWRQLLTSLPDYFMYKNFAIGVLLGTAFFRNSESPTRDTVQPFDGTTFSQDDPFAGELFAGGVTTGVPIHRVLFTAQDAIFEYYQALDALITEAGIVGRVGEPKVTNNSIEVFTDRIQLIIRAPMNRLQDLVSTTWKFIGDWPVRTDVACGDAARYKRLFAIEHA